jgi:hypothetical protein
LIKIWTRGQILAQNSTFSELPQNERERSPRHHEPNAIRFVSNGRREREISRSVRIVKEAKKRTLTGQSVQADVAEVVQVTWQNPYDDVAKVMWQFDWLVAGRIS